MTDERATILLVDDEPDFLHFAQLNLEDQGYAVSTAESARMAHGVLADREFDVVVVDVRMPGVDGISFMEKVKAGGYEGQFIVLTGFGSIDGAVQAMRKGAFTYLTKPTNPGDLAMEIEKAVRMSAVTRENTRLREKLAELTSGDTLLGDSPAMRRVKQLVSAAAACDSPVLITGESGTGKDVAARAVHGLSLRRSFRMVTVNCAAVPADLWESEMFGYEKGAFTGATGRKQGKIELAGRGTLFLDEILELPGQVQPKLLRVLENKCFERVGGVQTITVDFRLICATNRDLEEAIQAERFRKDLFYRLNVIPIHIPPLRERRNDIMPLAQHFLSLYSQDMKKRLEFTSEAEQRLEDYDWPGNVRELRNAIERAVVFAAGNQIGHLDLGLGSNHTTHASMPAIYSPMPNAANETMPLREAMAEFQRDFIQHALNQNNGNITVTAKQLQMARETLQRLVKKHRL